MRIIEAINKVFDILRLFNMLKTKIPPPVYLLLSAGVMWLLNQHFPLYHWLTSPWNKLGLGIISIALLCDFWSLFLFYRAKTTPNPMKPSNTAKLVTSGLYQYSRNPMYLGLLIMLAGWGIYLGSVSPFLILLIFVCVMTKQQIEPEEAALVRKFGNAYQDYQQQVRRWI
jgi:protein-S-isoprenylcysteine O-methyltransferase Ste14